MQTDYLSSVIRQFEYYKLLGDKTIARLTADGLNWQYNTESNSIATIVRHLHGNMLSRWTDFLTTDGEKESRNRDAEFENEPLSKAEVLRLWEEGWKCLLDTLKSLTEDDLGKIIYIRNQGHTVTEAINRQLAHYPYHIGQIIFAGKMILNENWDSLSIPRGQSDSYNAGKFSKEKKRAHFTDEYLKDKAVKIAVAGIGGVGAYIGSKLCLAYSGNPDFHISFICRGEHAEAIRQNGLQLISGSNNYVCRPDRITSDPDSLGEIDYLFICTKTYSVKEIISVYAKCLKKDAVVITLQNTISGRNVLLPLMPPGAALMEGVIYIASNLILPGLVHQLTGSARMFFGSDNHEDERGYQLEKILRDAGIDSAYQTDIRTELWKKFLFISPAAVVSAIYQIPLAEIPKSSGAHDLYVSLVTELMQLAKAMKINPDEHTIQNNLKLLGTFSPDTKSSFQLDLENNKPSEYVSLITDVINESSRFGLEAPNYRQSFDMLNSQYHFI